MRYQELPAQAERVASVSPEMTLGTVIYTLVLGIGFVIFGIKVRRFWVVFWGATMVVAGIAYLVATRIGLGGPG